MKDDLALDRCPGDLPGCWAGDQVHALVDELYDEFLGQE